MGGRGTGAHLRTAPASLGRQRKCAPGTDAAQMHLAADAPLRRWRRVYFPAEMPGLALASVLEKR